MNINSMLQPLANKKFTYATKGIMGAVVFTTALKAIGRPAFIYADKKSDPETKKYTAGKEFLYQLLCLGLTFAMILPTQRMTFNASKKLMKGVKELENIKTYKDFKTVCKDIDEFTPDAKKLLNTTETGLKGDARNKFNLVKGADEMGSFISSIVGLTIVAPLISHKILHPLMHALRMEKKESANSAPVLAQEQPKVDKQA